MEIRDSNTPESEKRRHWIIIAAVVIIIIILFVLTFGNFKPKEKDATKFYDDLDFSRAFQDIENAIVTREKRLLDIRAEKEQILRKLRFSIIAFKWLVVLSWLSFNTCIFYCYKDVSIENFIQWNEALIFTLIFVLFMISEKYSSLHLAFVDLKEIIVKRVLAEEQIFISEEKKLSEEIYFLEALYHTHPGIISKLNSNKKKS